MDIKNGDHPCFFWKFYSGSVKFSDSLDLSHLAIASANRHSQSSKAAGNPSPRPSCRSPSYT